MTLVKQYFNAGFGWPFRFRVNKERGQAVSASDCFTIYHWFQYIDPSPGISLRSLFTEAMRGKNKDEKKKLSKDYL
jgi:hypothetical protein